MGSVTLVARLEQSLEVLDMLGVSVPPGGRHRKALRVLRKWNDQGSLVGVGEQDLREIEASHRLSWETYLISVAAERMRRRAQTPFTPAKLRAITGGGILGEGRNSEPRDTQFELYIAALLHIVGLTVVRGEPDVLFDFGSERVGVAAKRLRSDRADQVERHVKKARDQVLASGHRGWIALNFDKRFLDLDPLTEQAKLLRAFERVFDNANAALQEVQEDQNVLGFLVFGYCSSWRTETDGCRSLHTAYPFRWVRWADTAFDEGRFQYFMDLWRPRLTAKLEKLVSPEFDGRL